MLHEIELTPNDVTDLRQIKADAERRIQALRHGRAPLGAAGDDERDAEHAVKVIDRILSQVR